MKKNKLRIFGTMLKNLALFTMADIIGFDYILNPESNELHKVEEGTFLGAHNLSVAHLGKFIGITNAGSLNIEALQEGTEIPITDLLTGKEIGIFTLNKCGHCF